MNSKQKNKIDTRMEQLAELFRCENDANRAELRASLIQLEILEMVSKIMEEKDISRSDLSEKLGKSKSFVSQLFSGDKALNLKMIAQFQDIFGIKFTPGFIDSEEHKKRQKQSC